MVARRALLRGAARLPLVAGLGAWPTVAAALESPAPEQAFGFRDDRVPMNAANLCPMPQAVSAAVQRFARSLDQDLSPANRGRIEALKESARAAIAAQLAVSADELAIVRNTSEANGIIVQGLALAPGDEVLVWEQNHPSNSLAWDVRAAREGLQVRRFALPAAPGSVDQVVDAVVAALGARTRVVTFTHISNVSGLRLPAAEICAALRQRRPELFIHVDGAQTWGVCDVDLGRMDCDSFSGSAHKWYMGPRETGILYLRSTRLAQVAPAVVSIPWGNEVTPAVAGARRFEALGQRDDAAIAALAETAAWHGAVTPATMEKQANAIAQRLRDGLQALGVPFVSPVDPVFTSNVIVLAASAAERRRLPQDVLERAGIITAGTGGLRLSVHVYNTPDHVDRVTRAVASLRQRLG